MKSWIFEEYSITFGMEFEFFSRKSGELYDPTIYYLPSRWLHAREYYFGMQEIMSNPRKFSLRNLRAVIKSALETLRRISEDNECEIPLYSYLLDKSYGIVSNGIHIHFAIYDKERKNILYSISSLPSSFVRMAMNIIGEKFDCSIRKLISHHLYGAVFPSEYNFKSHSKFIPVYLSPRKDRKPKTLEIRMFDLEDLFTPKKIFDSSVYILENVIHYIETGEYEKNELPYPYRIRDIEELIKEYEGEEESHYSIDFLQHVAKCYMDWRKEGRYFINGEKYVKPKYRSKYLEYFIEEYL